MKKSGGSSTTEITIDQPLETEELIAGEEKTGADMEIVQNVRIKVQSSYMYLFTIYYSLLLLLLI